MDFLPMPHSVRKGEGFFVLDLNGRAFRIGGHGLHLSQSRVSIEVLPSCLLYTSPSPRDS